jgi:hypothetical protein
MTDWADVLENDLRWRESELVSLKRLAIVNRDNADIFISVLRACWALLYAHYEGFTKFCWELLLDQIQNEKIPIKDLSETYQILALEKEFRSLRGKIDSASIHRFVNIEFPGVVSEDANFPEECRLQTESNLWPNVFERECARVGICCNELDSSRTRIKTLVARRNEIAHGKKMTIDTIEEYTEYESATLVVLHDLAVQVFESLENRKYMRI